MAFPDTQLPLHLEVALAANLSAHQSTWQWTDLSIDGSFTVPGTGGSGADALVDGPDALLWFGVPLAWGPDGDSGPGTTIDYESRILASAISISSGRADEASRSQPLSLSATLENDDGALTPRNPHSVYFPHFCRGLPIRATVEDLVMLRSKAPTDRTPAMSTPDNVAFDLTSEVFLAAEFQSHREQGVQHLIDKWSEVDNQRSYAFGIRDGKLVFRWSNNGTNVNEIQAPMPPKSSNGRVMAAVGVQDLGGGIRLGWFYYADVWGTWNLYFRDVSTSSVGTNFHSGTARLELGKGFSGNIFRAELRQNDSPASTILTSPIPSAETHGDTSLVDAQGRAWSVEAGGEITNRNIRFTGQISEIVPSWPAGDVADDDADGEAEPGEDVGHSNIDLVGSGVLRRLGQGTKEIESPIRRAVMSKANLSDLKAYWPMEEDRDALVFNSPISRYRVEPMAKTTEFTPASDDSLMGSKALPSFPGGWRVGVPRTVVTPSTFIVDCMVHIPERDANTITLMNVDTSGTWTTWSVRMSLTQIQIVWINRDGDNYGQANWSAPTFPTGWTHIRLTLQKVSGSINARIQAKKVDPLDVGGFDHTANVPATYIGQIIGINNYISESVMPPQGFSQGHLVVHVSRSMDWLEGADRGWVGEKAANRVARICDENGVSCSIIGPPDLSQTMGPQPIGHIIDILEDCVNVDLGLLNDSRHEIGIEYRSSASLYNQINPITVDARQNEISNPFVPVEDDQAIRNEVEVVMDSTGESWTESDLGSQDLEGIYDDSTTLNIDESRNLRHHAAWRLHMGTMQGMRYPLLPLDLAVAPSLIPKWLAATPGAALKVTSLPHQHPFDADVIIQGYTETMEPFSWMVEANCSRADIWTVGVLDDAVLGRIESDGNGIALPLDDSQTSFDVTSLGFAFIRTATHPTEFPFDILVNGEQMTVTGIVGAGPVQTFTVVRSVNGVVKSHLAGAKVALAHPIVIAL